MYRFVEISYPRRRTSSQHSTQGSGRSVPTLQDPPGGIPVVPAVSVDTRTSKIASPVKSSAGPAASYVSPAPRPRSLLYNGRSPVAPVSLELPRFADKDFVQSRIQYVMVATHPNPSSPESRASTVCVDLDAFPEIIHKVFCHIVCNIRLCFRRKTILCIYYIFHSVSVYAFVEKQVV